MNTIEDSWLLEKSFLDLLDQEELEQVYQRFIEEHTSFIPREFVQNHGVHLDLVFRKLSLGGNYTTDFCYLSKSSDDWHIVLIEIEKPQSQYFIGTSTKFHKDFQSARDQITQWKSWFDNRSNFDSFVNGTLGQVRNPLGYNPCTIKYVLVHGRRAESEGNEMRASLIRACENHDFKIMSFDSLAEDTTSKRELYLAVKKNDHLEISSPRFISDQLFARLPASYLRITNELRQSILDNKNKWRHVTLHSLHRYALEDRLPQIGVLRDTDTP